MLVKFSDALLSREQMKGVKGGCMYYDSQGGCADNFGTQYGGTPPCLGYPWECPGYVGPPPGGPFPNPGGSPTCWQNASTGAFSKNPNPAESGWFPTSSKGCNL